ncbi:4-hydroxyphenylacetate 3-monooxygenase [Actinosynnema sp. ALI-1.44]|uniref:4-hydroxyphenylacetate 3-hydroxylase family protein n=1 Tax=Actinosynnema sp. ALI-1.44 TaxID=1933779 RepID=UPI00097CA031|nr:4-hydroxyphenylacetate 3-hydroxylase N-terminal domain-containing protein [Actinosynnema sp. ALI-1.44]ONI86897.1 4-hydroxyphenylacetate 3-monooxygenase [Actinosynnema sp. ALI-1.44]
MTRTGSEYIESLRDGREVWYDGERVKDITVHPAFHNTIRSIAGLYDRTHEPDLRDVLTVRAPDGGRVLRAYQVPMTRMDLVAKRVAFKAWAEASFGFLGRSPDYMATAISGFAAAPHVFTGATFDGAPNVLDFHARMARNDLFEAHTLVNPQIDRTKTPSQQEEDDLYLRVVRERDDGIVVRGAKMVGTGAVFGDEILVGTTQRLAPADADYALSFSVPVSSPGVKFVSRASYEDKARSVFDYPLASRFDENDALVVYDNVFVPWENVLVYRDVDVCNSQWWKTPAFVNFVHHGATRLWTKFEFLTGIALLIAKANNTAKLPPVQAQIGKLMGWLNTMRSMVLALEAACETVDGPGGPVQPNKEISCAQLAVGPELYPQVLNEIKLLAGGGLIQLPASFQDLLNPETVPLLRKYIRSPGCPTEERVKLFKLAWDALGSEFAGRHEHYERFYHGAPHVYLSAIVREGDTDAYERLAQTCLDGYELHEEAP